MVFGKFISGVDDLTQVTEIRRKVFEEELGIFSEGEDLADAFCMHALAYDKDIPVGTGRILFDGEQFKIAGIAVLKEFRGQKYGDFLIRLLVDKAMMSNAQEICLDALCGTEGFFEMIGFEIAGEKFENQGSSWIPMILYSKNIHKCCDCG